MSTLTQAERTQRSLHDFLGAAKEVFGGSLRAAVLFGSAAEDRLRPSSDVNLLLVLKDFSIDAARLTPALAMARAAVDLRVLFLLEEEIPAALECFAQKFADILRRRRVLLGDDPFQGLAIPREAEILRTRQVLLNVALRLREQRVLNATQPDRLARGIVDSAGPLRACAATILEVEGTPAKSPRESFASLVSRLGKPELAYLPDYLSQARQGSRPPEPSPCQVIGHLIELASAFRARLEKQ
jgi:predicted nucleotidyltransferase